MITTWQILVHTPWWVWGLLVLVSWLGWRSLQARATTPAQLAILPAIAASVSLVSAATSVTASLALPSWLLALGLASPLGVRIGQKRRLEIGTGPRPLWLAGSRFPMALGLSIFVIRYAMGVAVARNPALAGEIMWIVGANALGGAVAGLGLGWLASLLLRYRRALDAADPITAS